MESVKDVVVFTFAGSKVKSVKREMPYESRVAFTDEMYSDGYPSIEVADASRVTVGMTRAEALKVIKR